MTLKNKVLTYLLTYFMFGFDVNDCSVHGGFVGVRFGAYCSSGYAGCDDAASSGVAGDGAAAGSRITGGDAAASSGAADGDAAAGSGLWCL